MRTIRRLLLLISVIPQETIVGQVAVEDVLKRADQLFWLDNWTSARTFFADAETISRRNGDKRNELYARFSRFRADAERESYVNILTALNAEQLNPLLSSDRALQLRFYVVRGSVNMSINPEAAKADWEQVLETARLMRAEAWEGRAKGELSICAFLAGDYATAKALSDEALQIATSTGDVASEVRQRSLKGVALLEQRRYDEAQALVDKAISLAERTPNIRFPIMAYMVKAEILTANGTPNQGEALISRAQIYLQDASLAVYLPDLYLQIAQQAVRRGDVSKAAELYNDTIRAAKRVHMPRPYSAAHFNLARIRHAEGDHRAALGHIQEALSASEQLVDTYVLPHQLALAAEITSARKDNISAGAYYERAQDVIEGLLTRTYSSGARSALIAAFSAVYFGNFKLAIAGKENAKAFLILERAKGRVITEILRSSSTLRPSVRSATSPISCRRQMPSALYPTGSEAGIAHRRSR